jgi:predicted acylesterase/phospholipase RssA
MARDHPRRTVREWLAGSPPIRGLVLSGGGLRGASHVGVLQQLVDHDVPVDVIVGASAGAVIAAYYAAIGLTVEALIDDAATFRGRHLIAHSVNTRLRGRWGGALSKDSGLIPERLEQLERATFDELHHKSSSNARHWTSFITTFGRSVSCVTTSPAVVHSTSPLVRTVVFH